MGDNHDPMPRRFLVSLRGLIQRRGHTVTSFAAATGIRRATVCDVLNGRGEFSGPQWRAVWRELGVERQLWEAMCRMMDEED